MRQGRVGWRNSVVTAPAVEAPGYGPKDAKRLVSFAQNGSERATGSRTTSNKLNKEILYIVIFETSRTRKMASIGCGELMCGGVTHGFFYQNILSNILIKF